MEEIKIRDEFIKLGQLLKLADMTSFLMMEKKLK